VSGTLGGQPIPPAQLAAMNQDSTSSGNEFDATYRCQQLEGDRIEVVNRFDDVRTLGSIRTPETDRLLEGFVGAEGRLVYDAQGRILEADAPDIEIDEDVAGPAFAQGMEQMLDSLDKTIEQSANPFPEEPVGVGGVWRVTAEVDVLGLETTSVTEYSVTRIEDDLVEANLTISLDLPGGDISLPGMPAAAGAEIVDGSMLGSGTSTWQLDSVVSYFEQVLDGTLTMRISSDDQAIELSMRQHQELSLQPR
jgi:hypothetical protein